MFPAEYLRIPQGCRLGGIAGIPPERFCRGAVLDYAGDGRGIQLAHAAADYHEYGHPVAVRRFYVAGLV